ncbi:MAG TPA: hypothetical protein VIC51_11395 [Psychromonas sp.]
MLDTIQFIIDNGFNAESMGKIIEETGVGRKFDHHPIVKQQFEECGDLEKLKAFALIMDEHHHIVDVESKMCELMGEDEYFEMVEG